MRTFPRLVTAVAVAAALVALTACAGPAGAPAPKKAKETVAPVPTRADADLVIWADDARAKVLQPFLDEFGKENGISAVVQTVNDNGRDSFVTATLANNGPDLVVGAHDWLGKFIENGVVSPIAMSEATKASFLPTSITAATSAGQLYGVPYAVENIGLVRNLALVPDVPATVEDMLATGNSLVADGTATNPFVMPVGQSGQPYYAAPFITSAGGYVFGRDANGDYNPKDMGLSGPGAAAAADKLAWMTEQGALSASIDYNEALDLFITGKAPYLVAGPWAIGDIKEAGIDYGISAIPAFKGGATARPFLGVQLFYVSSKAKNATFAQEFALNYLARPDVQLALYKEGQRPPALAEVNAQVAATDPDIRAWSAAGASGDPMPSIPEMDAVWGPLGVAVVNIVNGEGSPATSMSDAAKAITKAIG